MANNTEDVELNELTRYIVNEHADITYDDCTNTERTPLCDCHAKIKQLIQQEANRQKAELQANYEAMFQELINAHGYEKARAIKDGIEAERKMLGEE